MTGTAVAVDYDKCGGKKRQGGGTCKRPAGWGTEHPGHGPCKLHGGSNPIRHGRYSGIKRQELREAIEKHQADPDPLNLLPELAAARALFEDFINRYQLFTEALLSWHQSYTSLGRPLSKERIALLDRIVDEYEALLGEQDAEDNASQQKDLSDVREFVQLLGSPLDEQKPRRVLDIADAYRLLAEVRAQVSAIEAIDAANAISRRDFFRVMGEMGRVVELLVTDEDVKARIKSEWLQIRLA